MAKKKSFKLLAFTVLLSIFSGTAAITSNIFLKSYNNSLVVQKQDMERKIDNLEKKNDNCRSDLITLEGNERITAAAGKGMTYKPERVTVIRDPKKEKKK